MGQDSSIEWTDHSFNPWIGCTKVHQGCTNCYAEAGFDKRKHWAKWGPNGTRVMTSDENWSKPKAWNKAAKAAGVRHRVFCASLSDVFEDWDGGVSSARFINGRVITDEVWVTPNGEFRRHSSPAAAEILERQGMRRARLDDVRRRLFALIDDTPHLDWLLLTKRPENIRRMWMLFDYQVGGGKRTLSFDEPNLLNAETLRPNVWLGTSISDQASADTQIPELLKCRDLSPVLFLSAEPLLGPIDLTRIPTGIWSYGHVDVMSGYLCGDEPDEMYDYEADPHGWVRNPAGEWDRGEYGVDWVIVGGESGHGARPVHPAWVRSIRDQCQAAGVAFFFKQWGEWAPWTPDDAHDVFCTPDRAKNHVWPDGAISLKVGKKSAGRILDGREWSEFPTSSGGN